jgi:hypothetical protein
MENSLMQIMSDHHQHIELEQRWLTIDEPRQYPGHSPSWISSRQPMERLKETGFITVDPSLKRIDLEPIANRRGRDRQPQEQCNGREHCQ